MRANSAPSSKQSPLSVSRLLPKIAIYSAVVAGLIASFYDFQLNRFSFSSGTNFSQEKDIIGSINRSQQAYYAEYGEFSNDIYKLNIIAMKHYNESYNYLLLPSIGPVQTLHNQREPAQFESAIAIVEPIPQHAGKSYIGSVFAFKEKGSNAIKTITAICEGDNMNITHAELLANLPTFDGRQIRCQPGTTMLLW